MLELLTDLNVLTYKTEHQLSNVWQASHSLQVSKQCLYGKWHESTETV